MTEVAEAIYQNGNLVLLTPLSNRLKEGEKVKLTVETTETTPEEMLELAGKVYEGLSAEEIDELEKIILDRSNFFTETELNPIMKLAENFYEGLSDEEVDKIEKIILDRSNVKNTIGFCR